MNIGFNRRLKTFVLEASIGGVEGIFFSFLQMFRGFFFFLCKTTVLELAKENK